MRCCGTTTPRGSLPTIGTQPGVRGCRTPPRPVFGLAIRLRRLDRHSATVQLLRLQTGKVQLHLRAIGLRHGFEVGDKPVNT